MQRWTDGYCTETPYSEEFISALAPAELRLPLVLAGLVPPPLEEGFEYCELGCGQGLTTALLAAAYPQGRFTATDFNPVHIAHARRFCAERGIANAAFFDDAFAEFAARDLPQFDYVALHGIWSWVSAGQREVLLDFLARKLKVGGVAYVSYNAKPGKLLHDPLRRLFRDLSGDPAAPAEHRAARGMELLSRCLEEPCGVFRIIKERPRIVENLARKEAAYLAHEYMNEHWESFYCDQVHADLARARLSYVATLDPVLNMEALSVPPALAEDYRRLPGAAQKLVFRDLALNVAFRKDLFVRGPLPLDEAGQRRAWETTFLGRAPLHPEFVEEFGCPAGAIRMDRDPLVRRTYDLLGERSASMAELFTLAPQGPQEMLNILLLLLASEQVRPFAAAYEMPDGGLGLDRANAASLRWAVENGKGCWLCSRAFGNAVLLTLDECLMLDAMLRGVPGDEIPARAAAETFAARRGIEVEGRSVKSEADLAEFFARRWAEWRPAAPRELARAGILAPGGRS
ncbi:MAG: class I SAM-dependent methyltransferase [Thermodesulfobacteriota bacterium]